MGVDWGYGNEANHVNVRNVHVHLHVSDWHLIICQWGHTRCARFSRLPPSFCVGGAVVCETRAPPTARRQQPLTSYRRANETEAYFADGEVMCWVFELDRGFSFLNKSSEHFGYVILDLCKCVIVGVCVCVCVIVCASVYSCVEYQSKLF